MTTVHDDAGQMIAANLAEVRAGIAAAAAHAGRPVDAVRLVGVSKTFPVAAIVAAVQAGLTDIGENRVQEAEDKRTALDQMGIQPVWHLIGHLQTNKVKTALRYFDMIHSVDSLRLAEAINHHAVAPIDVLLEVNVAEEPSKFGLSPREVMSVAAACGRLEHLRLRGLMTVAPLADDPEAVRPVFRTLRELRDATGLVELSMGMSHDFVVAIEEGATMVRVGRAIFGPRSA